MFLKNITNNILMITNFCLAARLGRNVTIVERQMHVGGMTSSGINKTGKRERGGGR